MDSLDSFRIDLVKHFRPKRLDSLSLSWVYGDSVELICSSENGESYFVCRRNPDIALHKDEDGHYYTEPDDDYVFQSDNLPTEFFNHQLLEIDPVACSDDDLLAFARAWGFVYSPFRENLGDDTRNPYGDDLLKRSAEAIAKTEEAISGKYFPPSVDYSRKFVNAANSYPCISVSEMRTSLETIQLLVNAFLIYNSELFDEIKIHHNLNLLETDANELNAIFAHDKSDELGRLLFDICNPTRVNSGLDFSVSFMQEDSRMCCRGMLTYAIYFQLFDAINDSTSWKLCECEGCHRIFKHKQSSKRKSDQSERNRDDSAYCCDACKERQMKRNQRKKNK